MLGFPLEMFKGDLMHVPEDLVRNPVATLDVPELLGAAVVERIMAYDECDIDTVVRRATATVLLKRLTFDQLCKIHCSQTTLMHRSVETLFEDDPEFSIVRKIKSSMWRWGCGDGHWNEIVDAYYRIRAFTIPLDEFEVRLDYTTAYHPRGYGLESRIYLDGVFGFLVYFRGKHVMTFGFSISEGRRVLLQQVQMAQRKGNRFLFKLPAGPIEFALQCFVDAFPEYEICIADGGDISQVNLASYGDGLLRAIKRVKDEPTPKHIKEKEDLEACIAHLSAEAQRLEAMYANTGSFVRCGEFVAERIRHYPVKRIEASSQASVAMGRRSAHTSSTRTPSAPGKPAKAAESAASLALV